MVFRVYFFTDSHGSTLYIFFCMYHPFLVRNLISSRFPSLWLFIFQLKTCVIKNQLNSVRSTLVSLMPFLLQEYLGKMSSLWRSIFVVVASIFVVVAQIEHVLGNVIVVCVFIATLNYRRPKEKVVLVRKQRT
jgi:hypothetical protein